MGCWARASSCFTRIFAPFFFLKTPRAVRCGARAAATPQRPSAAPAAVGGCAGGAGRGEGQGVEGPRSVGEFRTVLGLGSGWAEPAPAARPRERAMRRQW